MRPTTEPTVTTIEIYGQEHTVNVATCRPLRYSSSEPCCLDCAAAVGGPRVGLPKALRGRPCASCVTMLEESLREAREDERYQEAMDELAEHPERFVVLDGRRIS